MVRIFFSRIGSGLGRKYTGHGWVLHSWESADHIARLGTEVKEVQILACSFNVLSKYGVVSLEPYPAS